MDHNKVIARAAKRSLLPHGLRRDGKSRVWYDDHGWSAVVVEFQPSSWSRGSYLNVGASWMLYENSHWTFDIGSRRSGFESAEDEERFERAMESMAGDAANHVFRIREEFSSLAGMRAHYQAESGSVCWPGYYSGVLAGLDRDWDSALSHLKRVADYPCTVTWHHARRYRCLELLRALGDEEWFREQIMGIVLRCRSARCLEELPISEIAFPE